MTNMSTQSSESDRKRAVRKSALALLALALFFYLGFIALSVFRSQ